MRARWSDLTPGEIALYIVTNTTNERVRFRYLHMYPKYLDQDRMVSGRVVHEGEVVRSDAWRNRTLYRDQHDQRAGPLPLSAHVPEIPGPGPHGEWAGGA